MALSIVEQSKVINGEVKPNEISLLELVVIVARRYSQYFYLNHKETDDETSARNYVNKTSSVANRVISGDSSIYYSLLNNIINKIGNTYSYTQIEAFTNDSQWEDMIENNISNVFEVVGFITREETAHYNGLPNYN